MNLLLAQDMAGSNLSYANQTTVHPVGLAAVAALSLFLLLSPRRWTPLAFVLMACLIPSAQRIVVMGLDFNFIRILVIVGVVRVVLRSEYAFQFRAVDGVMIAWGVVSTLAYTAQFGSVDALVNRLGASYDALGVYFLFRCLTRTLEDVKRIVVVTAWVAVPVAALFLVEKSTGRNLFSVFGGVPEITDVRQGRLRCQGAFSHPILAGTFWAALIPLIGALYFEGGVRRLAGLVGSACGIAIVYSCASSTPVLALSVVVVGAALLPLRHYLGYIRLGTVAILVFLHLVMLAPVWHLIARVSAVGGSTGWHRYHLIDKAIRRIDEWALLGTRSTAHWGYGLQDVTNQYILEAVRGGLLTLVLFVAVIVLCFRSVGRAWRSQPAWSPSFIMAWAVGVALSVHCVSFIGVSYFGQITMLWYMTLAIAASLDQMVQTRPAPVRARTQPAIA